MDHGEETVHEEAPLQHVQEKVAAGQQHHELQAESCRAVGQQAKRCRLVGHRHEELQHQWEQHEGR